MATVTKNVAVGWFPAGELEKALGLWPNLLEGWNVSTHHDYCRSVDSHLRQLELLPDANVLLARIEVKNLIKWCARERMDPASPQSRAAYATEVATRGRVQQWPPRPGHRCWCGSGDAYETCCGIL
jgi:hypothetical protein